MVILCSEASLVWGKDAVFQTAQMDITKRWTPQVDTKKLMLEVELFYLYPFWIIWFLYRMNPIF